MANKSINKCICEYCGAKFISRNSKSTCCRDIQCLKSANHKVYSALNEDDFKYTKVCEVCGETFYTNNVKAKCCTALCCGSMGIRSPLKQFGEPKYTETVTCVNCGNDFEVKCGTSKSHKHCSKQCRLDYSFNIKAIEFVGNKFGIVNIDYLQRKRIDNRESIIAYYTCECGDKGSARIDLLRDGYVRSCGCLSSSLFDTGNHGLLQYMRRKITPWIRDSKKRCCNKCDITGSTNNHAVHHLYPFASIVKEALDKCDLQIMEVAQYTRYELKHLTKTFLKLHNDYPLGMCLSKEVHVLFHCIYGYKGFTPDNYYEFKQKFINGELG